MSRESKAAVKRVARRSIDDLLAKALDTHPREPDLADRYADTARRISMRCRVPLGKEWKLHICKRCKRFLTPNVSSRIRIRPRRSSHVTITCLHCGYVRRIPVG
ncbi:MAG: ribonuclease P [Candidatus Bathyarchaeia archaeon]